jgi:HAD superfamily hydrolase (TIGR01549 family)
LFDWDGTIIDSAAASFRAYQRLFGRFGIDYDHERFEATYAPDWYHTYRLVRLPEAHWAEADAHWLECYGEEPSDLIDGARAALDRLRALGITLGIVTSGDGGRVRREIEALGLAGFFATIVSATDTTFRKPAPEPLLQALDTLGLPASASAYVGDSPDDVKMARAAGAFSVGIPGGFPNQQTLIDARPDFLARSLAEAVDHLTRTRTTTRDSN